LALKRLFKLSIIRQRYKHFANKRIDIKVFLI
jgi:hypothetical protein